MNQLTALVLSGGGSNGDYEVGVVEGLAARGFSFDIIVGTSIGAWNGAWLAQYPASEFQEAASNLRRKWLTTLTDSSTSIWVERWRWLPRPLRYLSALFNPSIGKNDPARVILAQEVDFDKINNSGVSLSVNAVDLRTGAHEVYATPYLHPSHVMGSSSYPFAMQPEVIGDSFCTDGGLINMAMLGQAIKMGADRIVVVSTRDPRSLPPMPELGPDSPLVPDLAGRMLQIMVMHMLFNDIEQCRKINNWIAKGYLNHPQLKHVDLDVIYSSDLLADPLVFTREKAEAQMALGFKDVANHFGGAL